MCMNIKLAGFFSSARKWKNECMKRVLGFYMFGDSAYII